MVGAITQSNSNLINSNKMARVNINKINYINLAWAETQSVELYLVFIEGEDSLYRIPPLWQKKKKKKVDISPVTFKNEYFLFGQHKWTFYIFIKGDGCSSVRY